MSLGRHLRTSWSAFGRPEHGYLQADAARTAALRARLTRDGRPVIGLSWQSRNPSIGAAKTASLRDFAAMLRVPGVRFVDLQYGDTTDERAAVRKELGVEVERLADVDNLNDIDGLAALISACDAVLTVSNTTAHLAGALGRPVWVLVPGGSARLWYWFPDRERSPWYPRVHVKRKVNQQTWAALIDSVVDEISGFIATQASAEGAG